MNSDASNRLNAESDCTCKDELKDVDLKIGDLSEKIGGIDLRFVKLNKQLGEQFGNIVQILNKLKNLGKLTDVKNPY